MNEPRSDDFVPGAFIRRSFIGCNLFFPSDTSKTGINPAPGLPQVTFDPDHSINISSFGNRLYFFSQ